ncbi:MAG: molybdenum cofactor biosynthesis protein B [Halobacteriales archaeon]
MDRSGNRKTGPKMPSSAREDGSANTLTDGGKPEGREPDGEQDHDHGHDHGHDHNHAHDHDHGGVTIADIGVAVVTISSTRTREDDASGDAIVAALETAGASIETRDLIPDDHDRIRETVDSLVERPAIDAVITTGGTGVTPDDVTVDAVRPLFGTELPGFGELFRRYSEAEIGTRVVATRATAGIVGGIAVFCLPGSENAATLGTEEIILPEAAHLVGLAGGEGENEPERVTRSGAGGRNRGP